MAEAPHSTVPWPRRAEVPRRGRSLRPSDAQVRAALRSAVNRFHTRPVPRRPLVLIGLMGVGKTAVGKRLARVTRVPFVDSDEAIERAAGMQIRDIFDAFDEDHFRDRERAVIDRLLRAGEAGVIATGGGAFMNAQTRASIFELGLAVWLHAPLPVLVERTCRTTTRPLLAAGDPQAVLEKLLAEREPTYRQAPVHCPTGLGHLDRTVLRLLTRVNRHIFGAPPQRQRRRRAKPRQG